jgi:hypothetical protein
MGDGPKDCDDEATTGSLGPQVTEIVTGAIENTVRPLSAVADKGPIMIPPHDGGPVVGTAGPRFDGD